MINVIKNRARLCALTTSALFFLQGVNVSMGNGILVRDNGLNSNGLYGNFISVTELFGNDLLGSYPQKGRKGPYVSYPTSINGIGNGIGAGLGMYQVPVTSVPNLKISPQPNQRSVPQPLRVSQADNRLYTCDAKSYNDENQPIRCDDGEAHKVRYGAIKVKKYGDNAVQVAGSVKGLENELDVQSISSFMESQNKTTRVSLYNMSIAGVYSSTEQVHRASMDQGFGSAIFADVGGRAVLESSQIKNFVAGLEAQHGGKIVMKGGRIEDTHIGALAVSESSIALERVVIDASKDRKYSNGLHSLGLSGIKMKSGAITFAQGGIGAISEDYSSVVLEGVVIKVKPYEREDDEEAEGPDGIGFLSTGGFVAFNKGKFSGSNVAALWLTDESFSAIRNDLDSVRVGVSTSGGYAVSPEVDDSAQGSMPDIDPVGEAATVIQSINNDDGHSVSLKLVASMKESDIIVNGKDSYGIYFDKTVLETVSESLSPSNHLVPLPALSPAPLPPAPLPPVPKDPERSVFLQGTTLNVPEGIAIYGEKSKGRVILGESKLYGSLLLKAEFGFDLTVLAHKSTLRGGAHVDQNARAELILSESEWHLAKSEDWKSSAADCMDSCISAVTLTDGAIGFIPPVNGKKYQTLRIGEGEGKVYSASGDSKIYLNVSVEPLSKDSRNEQISDRILIHGDVEGKTTVHINSEHMYKAVSRAKPQRAADDGRHKDQYRSIPIIQVYGNTEQEAFKLENQYITLDGLPYQFVLRAYGPEVAPGMQKFGSGLSKPVWDFRLEGKKQNAQQNAQGEIPTASDMAGSRYMGYDFWPLNVWDSTFADRLLSLNLLPNDVFPSPSVILNKQGEVISYDYSYMEGVEDYEGLEFDLEEEEVEWALEDEDEDEDEDESLPILESSGMGRSLLALPETDDPNEDLDYPTTTGFESEAPILPTPLAETTGRNGTTLSMSSFSASSENVNQLQTTDENGQDLSIVLLSSSSGGTNQNEAEDAGYDIVDGDLPTDDVDYTYSLDTDGLILSAGDDVGISRLSSSTGDTNQDGAEDAGYYIVSDDLTSDDLTTDTIGNAYTLTGETLSTGGENSEALTIPPPIGSSVSAPVSSEDTTDILSEETGSEEIGSEETGNETNQDVPSSVIPSTPTPTSSEEIRDISRQNVSSSTRARSDTGSLNVNLSSGSSGSVINISGSSSSGRRVSSTAVPSDKTKQTSAQAVTSSAPQSTGSKNSGGVESTANKSAGVSKGTTTSEPKKKVPASKTKSKPVARVLLATGNAETPKVSSSTVSSKAVSVKSQASGAVSTDVDVNGVVQNNISSQCNSAQGNGEGKQQVAYLCSDGKSHTMTSVTLKASDAQHSMHAKQNTVITLEAATIIGSGTDSDNLMSAVFAEEKAEVVLDKKSTIQSSAIGLEAQKGGTVKVIEGTVNANYVGALVDSESSINLKDTKINVMADSAIAGLASSGGKITMDSGSISVTGGTAVRSELGGNINLEKVNITVKKQAGTSSSTEKVERAAILLNNNGSVDLRNGTVSTDATALWIKENGDAFEVVTSRKKRSADVRPAMNHANIESSTVKVEGDQSYGIYFDGAGQKRNYQQDAVSQQEKTPIHVTGAISLKKTNFEVANGIVVYANNSNGKISLANESILAGDLLLSAENNSSILALVDNSAIVGGARVDKGSYAQLDLTNKSAWILTRSAHNIAKPDSGCVDSCVSSVSLVNSLIKFVAPKSGEKYQTLHIGEGKGTVYRAEGDALIHLNAHLSPNDPSDKQVTDRLVIRGDVSGKTIVHVQGVSEDIADKGHAKNPHSVSIIQVYGTAEKDSFQLYGNYVALQNSPYKYTLRSYSPEATEKQEHVEQKFIKDGGEFWNFRLENQYVKSALPMVGSALPEQFVRSVVPQVPTYLLLPNSVFHAGLMDINNQSKQLETLRATYNGMVEVRENPALYLRGYGGSYRYTSDLSVLEYGYKGDLNYNGVEAGLLLQTIENADSALSFGVLGSYGKLSLQPVDVEQSQESAFDKWTATAYGSMQHDAGFYVDGLLSYGLLKGDVLTLARGKTATLKGNPLSVSLTGGQTIATGYKGFVVDPQVQVVYQHLQFEKARDIDNFDIEMGKLDQWIARVGGRVTKTPKGSEGVDAVAFYSKLYLVHDFEGKKFVHFKDAFQLGAFGSSLEAGLGFNAKLSSAFSLHGDIVYQHKLNKAGFSGTSFSGGVRYQF